MRKALGSIPSVSTFGGHIAYLDCVVDRISQHLRKHNQHCQPQCIFDRLCASFAVTWACEVLGHTRIRSSFSVFSCLLCPPLLSIRPATGTPDTSQWRGRAKLITSSCRRSRRRLRYLGRPGHPRQPPAKQELPQAFVKKKGPKLLGRITETVSGQVFRAWLAKACFSELRPPRKTPCFACVLAFPGFFQNHDFRV